MKKLLFSGLMFLFLFNIASDAQWRINTSQGYEYDGVITYEDKDSLKLRDFEDNEFMINRAIIDSTERIETRVETKSGDVYIGHVSDLNDSELTIQPRDADTLKIQRDNIAEIQYLRDYVKIQNRKTSSRSKGRVGKKLRLSKVKSPKSDFDDNKPYSMFGATVFFPGGINLLYGKQSEIFGFRISGGYSVVAAGLQINGLLNFGRTKNVEHNLSIGLGVVSLDGYLTTDNGIYMTSKKVDLNVKYAALLYDFNLGGLFGEIGIAVGSDIIESPFPVFQVGYVHRFND